MSADPGAVLAMIDLETIAPVPAAVDSWPAAVVAVVGLVLGVLQWRQTRVTRGIEHELKPARGKSTRDVVDRLEQGQAELAANLTEHLDADPARRRRARAEAAGFAAMAALLSVAVTLSRTRR